MSAASLRASSIGDLFDCAMRWEARNLLRITQPSSGAAHLGTSIHAGTEAYDRASLIGAPISIDDATGVMVETLHQSDREIVWDDGQSPAKIEPIAIALLRNYCEIIAPDREYVAIEARADDLTIDVDGFLLTLTGTVDRIRRDPDGALGICDLKTGKTAVGTDGTVAAGKHAAQLGAYEILAQHTIGQPMSAPAEIIGMQTNSKARVGSGLVDRPRDILIGGDDYTGLIEMAVGMLRVGLFPPNNRSILCSGKFCPIYSTCPYRS
jgi:hypothetical protein